MKERYNIEIADIQLTVLSDEPEDFITSIVAQLDTRVQDLTVKNKRCSKLDAALLCALDSLSEKLKDDKKIKNLEAQISLYEANIKRLREELDEMRKNASASGTSPVQQAAAQETETKAESAPTETETVSDEKAPENTIPASAAVPENAPQDSGIVQEPPVQNSDDTPATNAPKEETIDVPAEEPHTSLSGIHDAKLRQIEELLRQRSESSINSEPTKNQATESAVPTVSASRDAKLREIEELLRKNGSARSLSEALQDATRN